MKIYRCCVLSTILSLVLTVKGESTGHSKDNEHHTENPKLPLISLNTSKEACADVKTSLQCNFWKYHGSCITHKHRMMQLCPKTCNLCDDVKKCKGVPCPVNKHCTLDSEGKPVCKCSLECKLKALKKKLGPVCGTDGNNYINICKMQFTSCEQDKTIAVKNFGQCVVYGECQDRQKKEVCLGWQKAEACTYYEPLMKIYCRKTCGMCEKRASAPLPDCNNSVYGCCPDNRTAAKGPNGKGCPDACQDTSRACVKFAKHCSDQKGTNKRFMEKHCRKTCFYCREEE